MIIDSLELFEKYPLENKDEIQDTIEDSEDALVSNIFKGLCGFETEMVLDYKKKFKEKQGVLAKKR